MKIFILAFCIFQISLAQDPTVVANQQLVAEVIFVMQRNRHLNLDIYGYGYNFLYVLTLPLLYRNTLHHIYGAAKTLTEGIEAAGISLETLNAFVSYNIYADVMNGLASKINSGGPPFIPRVSLPANLEIQEVTAEIADKLVNRYKFIEAINHLEKGIGGSPQNFFYDFVGDIFLDLYNVLDPAPAANHENLIQTLTDQFVNLVTDIVNNGSLVDEVTWFIVSSGLNSVIDSYNELINYIYQH